VINEKTYLFYDQFPGGNTLDKWNKKSGDEKQVQAADKRWEEIKG